MRGTPYFGNLEGTCAYQGLSEVTHGEPKIADAQQASRGCSYDATINVNISATLTEVSPAFPQFKANATEEFKGTRLA
jgi:hypothetical protein